MKRFQSGIKYAFIFMIIGALMGFLYGLISGVILQPMIFTVIVIGVFVSINFSISILSLLPLFILKIMKKKTDLLENYFTLSSAFFSVFFPVFIFLKLGFYQF